MMSRKASFLRRVRQVAGKDGRYDVGAYLYLFEALGFTQRALKRDSLSKDRSKRHVTGRELLEGIRRYALKQFGFMARVVFEGWGVKRTDDFGEIVFNLVDASLLGKSDTDSREDFHAVYDFRDALDGAYRFDGDGRATHRTIPPLDNQAGSA